MNVGITNLVTNERIEGVASVTLETSLYSEREEKGYSHDIKTYLKTEDGKILREHLCMNKENSLSKFVNKEINLSIDFERLTREWYLDEDKILLFEIYKSLQDEELFLKVYNSIVSFITSQGERNRVEFIIEGMTEDQLRLVNYISTTGEIEFLFKTASFMSEEESSEDSGIRGVNSKRHIMILTKRGIVSLVTSQGNKVISNNKNNRIYNRLKIMGGDLLNQSIEEVTLDVMVNDLKGAEVCLVDYEAFFSKQRHLHYTSGYYDFTIYDEGYKHRKHYNDDY